MAWTLRYAHDSNGTPLPGHSLDVLRPLLEAGAAVRVAYIPDWSDAAGVDPEYPPYARLLMDVDPVLSRPGAVFGQAEWRSLDLNPPYDAITFSNTSSHYILNLSTTGRVWRRAVRSDGQPAEPDALSQWAMEWYCDI